MGNMIRKNIEGTWWQSNLECLAEYRPELLSLAKNIEWQSIGSFFQTASGDVSIELVDPHDSGRFVQAYGTDNPWNDVGCHLQTIPVDSHGTSAFIGMGLGYGPLLILRERPMLAKIAIFEPSLDYFCAALQAVDLRPLIISDRVFFYVGEINYQMIENDLGREVMLEDVHILRHVPGFQWQPRMYESVNNQAFSVFNELNIIGSTNKKCGEKFFSNRLANLTLLRHGHNLDLLQNSFVNKPAVLVAAGPSLDQSMSDLKKVVGKCVLIVADSALVPLINNGIVPDFVTTLDFQDLNFEKMAPCMGQNWSFSLVSNIKGTPIIPKRFPAKHLFFGFPEDKPHMWMAKSLGVKQFIPPMSSVANLSLGLAILMGADPIFFVGQDLSFTSKENDHVDGAIFHSVEPGCAEELQFVEGIGGSNVATARNLMALQKQFEDVILSSTGNFWNCSAAGVRLKGAPSVALAEAVERFMKEPVAVLQDVDKVISSGKDFAVQPFLREAAKVRGKIAAHQKKLKGAMLLAKKISVFLGNTAHNLPPAQSFEDLAEKIKQKMCKLDNINCFLDKDSIFWDHVLELTFDKLVDNDRIVRVNEQLLEKEGYLSWLCAEVMRIETVNKVRLSALQVYGEKLGAVVNHLNKEKKLQTSVRSKGKFEDCLALARIYNESGDLNVAKNVLVDCASDSENKSFDLLKGEVFAGTLDYENAWRCWHKAAECGSVGYDEVFGVAARGMAPWLDGIEKLGDNHGNNPILMATMFERVDKLLLADESLPVRLVEIWQANEKEISSLLDAQESDKAMRAINPWLIFSPRMPEISFMYARLLYIKNEFPEAIQQLSEALGREPGKAGWLAFLARMLLESGQFDLGIEKLQEAVCIDPQHAGLWEELGDVLVADCDLENALIAYEKCFLALPDRVDVLNKMGDVYLQNQQTDAAVAAYQAVLDREPGNELVRHKVMVLQAG